MSPYYEALPTNLKPVHYALSIFDIEIPTNTFKGTVVIDLEVAEPTDEIHLHYRDLTIDEVTVSSNNSSVVVESITENKQKEFFVVKLGQQLTSGGAVVAKINYRGVIQTNMAGFYRSDYTEGGESKVMLSTQFEATDARRAFPCLDEPLLKATFTVDVTAESKYTFLSNYPVALSTDVGNGLTKVEFETTAKMSTYLLAWVLGEFKYLESYTDDKYIDGKPLPVRIYAADVQDGVFASQVAPKFIDYFSRIFEIKYPFPKMDLAAIESFSHNAMENVGCCVFRPSALLFSEAESDPSYKKNVAYVVSHELAHQHFGDLVTMTWWDDLWLNEGFATFVGYLGVEHLFPEWDVFSTFVSDSMQKALDLDGLRNSHPIRVPVYDALDIDQLFDTISYLKGSSVISMLSQYLGAELFLKGVARYLKKHEYGNATSIDLWTSISEVSGKPIDKWMDSWITKIGFPIVDVKLDGNKLVLKQSRFLNGGDATAEENQSRWWIPLNIGNDDIKVDSFEEESLTIENFPLANSFFKLNKDTAGFYRVNYSDEILQKNILDHFDRLSTRDIVGLLADSSAIAIAGHNTTESFLNLVRNVVSKIGDDYVVWLELGKRLNNFANVFTSDKVTQFIRSIYEKKSAEFINVELKDDDDFLKVKLRSEILSQAGGFEIESVHQYAVKLFESGNVPPSLRLFVYKTIASSPKFTEDQFQTILNQVVAPSSLDSREIALTALGSVSNTAFAERLYDLLTKPDVIPIMDSHFLGEPLSRNKITKDSFLQFFLDNYDDKFYKSMSTNMVVLDRFIKLTLLNYRGEDKYRQIDEFFKARDIHGFERSLHQSLDNIKINTNWFVRDAASVEQYL
ncbi:AAP1 Alanine/arginine aminopeptidase [Candida maltosa Xu316]|uniref:Aminopeptidase n=1 Tax=Candida maltosa (strain Xu316) TaxID=1245528 RepID=M3K3Q5_CANMX|nr:Arginine/alanine aminopeptidase [Candida maltosa Xu316]